MDFEKRGLESPLLFVVQKSMVKKELIEEIVQDKIDREDIFLVDVILSGTKSNTKISVLLDGDNGVDIDTCASISRRVGAELEERDIIPGAYLLEVSSPGLDHPLKLKRQYHKNKGRQLKIILNNDQIRKGELVQVFDDKIIINEQVKEKGKKPRLIESELPFSEIKKTFVLVSFK